MTIFEPNLTLERFAELSWRAQHFALLICAFGFTLVAYAILRIRIALRARGHSLLSANLFCTFSLLIAYVGYTEAFIATWWAMEWHFTHQVQFCHLPGTTPRILPVVCLLVAGLLVALEANETERTEAH